MKKALLFLFFINCLSACSHTDTSLSVADNVQKNSNQSDLSGTNINPTPTAALRKTKMPVPRVSDFSIETFFRHSERKDEKKNMLPPYQYGEISFFVASRKVKFGDFATAVPLEIDYRNLALKIKKIERIRFLNCDVEKTGSDIEFGKITDKDLLEAKAVSGRAAGEEQPFDFLVIYPAVWKAEKLKKTDLTKAMLPEKVEVEQVVAAIDLNDDGNPDLLINNYCCYDSSQCDCTEKFQKIASEWKYLGGSEPC